MNPAYYQPVETAPGERRLLKVPAIKPDVVLLHAQQADELGNVQYRAPVFFDVLMAQAAKHVIVSVDRIVSHETVRKSHALTRLSSAFVDTIVEARVRRASDGQRRPLRSRRGACCRICEGERQRNVLQGLSRPIRAWLRRAERLPQADRDPAFLEDERRLSLSPDRDRLTRDDRPAPRRGLCG